MSGLSSGSTQTYDGGQSHAAPNWVNDPLPSDITQFMSTTIAAGFGPLFPPFLSNVSTLTGTGYTALAAVPTPGLPVPFAVDLLISNTPQRQFLVAGAYPGTPGTTPPNDYNPVTNLRYWVQLQ